MTRVPTCIVVVAAFVLATPVAAAPITYTFSGTITEAGGSHLSLRMPNLSVGDAFDGFLTMDPDDLFSTFLSVTLTDATFTVRPDLLYVFTDDEGADRLNASRLTWAIESDAYGYFRGEQLLLRMVDPTGTALNGYDLYQDLSAFETGSLRFLGDSLAADYPDPTGFVFWTGSVTTWARVPEPATLLLLLLGGLSLDLRRRHLLRPRMRVGLSALNRARVTTAHTRTTPNAASFPLEGSGGGADSRLGGGA